jgi:hypothetical protein
VDILITALSALGAALIVLAIAVLWVAARYDAASSETSRPAAPDQPPRVPRTRTRRFRRQARLRASTRR